LQQSVLVRVRSEALVPPTPSSLNIQAGLPAMASLAWKNKPPLKSGGSSAA
ncbi:transposase, partial [Pseudomonas sp. FFUP_PS_473]